uniref:Uncharacterized protein n=1 Tax=Oryza glaberrima TaxID=4538 RepID=I1QH76_ORYGL
MVVLTGTRWTALSGDGLRRTRGGRGGPQACEPDGGSPSGGERRPEAVVGGGARGKRCGGDRGLGRARQKGENGEGDAGLLFMGEEGADEGSENFTKNPVNVLRHVEPKKNPTISFPIINCID